MLTIAALDAAEASAFASRWLPAWTGNQPERLVAFYSDDVFYSDPGVPQGVRGREALLAYFRKLLARNPDWVWTHRGSVPLADGFLNQWHASMPVGAARVEVDGVCMVQLRDGLIYRNEVFFDRSELLAAWAQARAAAERGAAGGAEARLERMKALVEAHYDAAVNHQDLARVDEQLAADFVDHASPPGTPPGPEPVKAWLAGLKKAFPDLRVVTDDVVAEGDRVAVRATWTGTHAAEFLGVPASGRRVQFSGAVFWRIANERIAERWAHVDMQSLLAQLRD